MCKNCPSIVSPNVEGLKCCIYHLIYIGALQAVQSSEPAPFTSEIVSSNFALAFPPLSDGTWVIRWIPEAPLGSFRLSQVLLSVPLVIQCSRSQLQVRKFSTSQLTCLLTILDLQISCEEARDIVETIKKFSYKVVDGNERYNAFSPENAFELFEREKNRVSIVTFCEQLDEMLGGGVATGKITEFCGPPGIGKTQMG